MQSAITLTATGAQKQFTQMMPKANHLIVLVVPPLPALLVILFLLVIKEILIKLFRTFICVVQVFGTLILTGLAQNVFMLLIWMSVNKQFDV